MFKVCIWHKTCQIAERIKNEITKSFSKSQRASLEIYKRQKITMFGKVSNYFCVEKIKHNLLAISKYKNDGG